MPDHAFVDPKRRHFFSSHSIQLRDIVFFYLGRENSELKLPLSFFDGEEMPGFFFRIGNAGFGIFRFLVDGWVRHVIVECHQEHVSQRR
jgi:hypothetical protein